jgi:ATP-binding cassette subfamily E protein 1
MSKNYSSYVIVVEHDLAICDFLSDFVCLMYGSPRFLGGFIPSENLRFRQYSLSFNLAEKEEEEIKSIKMYTYPSMTKKFEGFELSVDEGSFNDSEIVVMFGENGTGKTTFIRMLAGAKQATG